MGLFGGPSASGVLANAKPGQLAGYTALVTGANSGTGFATAEALARAGARVILAGRRLDAIDAAVAEIGDKLAESQLAESKLAVGSVEALAGAKLDLNDLASVREYAAAYVASGAELQLLVLNAGVMLQPWGRTPQGFDTTMGVNHLGHFLLLKKLDKTLRESPTSGGTSKRVVFLSSMAHAAGKAPPAVAGSDGKLDFATWFTPTAGEFSIMESYGNSKLANLLCAKELARRYAAEVHTDCAAKFMRIPPAACGFLK